VESTDPNKHLKCGTDLIADLTVLIADPTTDLTTDLIMDHTTDLTTDPTMDLTTHLTTDLTMDHTTDLTTDHTKDLTMDLTMVIMVLATGITKALTRPLTSNAPCKHHPANGNPFPKTRRSSRPCNSVIAE